MPVYNHEFNAVVKHIGSLVPHTLTGSDYADFAEMKLDYERTGKIKVNVNHSVGTIFGDSTINWLFRAWHDACHIKANADFTLDGEALAAEYMKQTIRPLLPNVTDAQYETFCKIIDCEVKGQGDYFTAYGEFPLDQYAFSVHYLATGSIPAQQAA